VQQATDSTPGLKTTSSCTEAPRTATAAAVTMTGTISKQEVFLQRGSHAVADTDMYLHWTRSPPKLCLQRCRHDALPLSLYHAYVNLPCDGKVRRTLDAGVSVSCSTPALRPLSTLSIQTIAVHCRPGQNRMRHAIQTLAIARYHVDQTTASPRLWFLSIGIRHASLANCVVGA
jgi:hypothetical protein